MKKIIIIIFGIVFILLAGFASAGTILFSDNCTDNATEWDASDWERNVVAKQLIIYNTTWFAPVDGTAIFGLDYNLTAGHTYSSFYTTSNWSIHIRTFQDGTGSHKIGLVNEYKTGWTGEGDTKQFWIANDNSNWAIYYEGTKYWDIGSSPNGMYNLEIRYNWSGDNKFDVLSNGSELSPATDNANGTIYNITIDYIILSLSEVNPANERIDWFVFEDNVAVPPSADNTSPVVTWIHQPDLNLTDEINATYMFNITDTQNEINLSTVIFYHGLNCSTANDMNKSYRYPASPKQPEQLRNYNRNDSIAIIEDNAIRLYPNDIVSYGAHLYNVSSRPLLYESGTNWVAFNFTANFHHLMESHIPVDRIALHKEDKTAQYISIYKNSPAMIELKTFPLEVNRTIHLNFNIDDQNSPKSLLFYICNASISPLTVNPVTDAYCGFISTKTDFNNKYRIAGNSSYILLHLGISETGILNGFNFSISETMWLILDSDANSNNAYKLYVANNTVVNNTNFYETYYLYTGDASWIWNNRSETPDVMYEVTTDTYNIRYYVHACDDAGNCVNSSFQKDALGARPNEVVGAPFLIQPLNGSILSGFYNITWLDGADPENDPFNITLLLINGSDNTINSTLTINISNGTEFFQWNTTTYNDYAYYQIFIYACDIAGCSENDTSEGNFTIDNTAPIITILTVNQTYNETYNYNLYINLTLNELGNCTLNDTNFNPIILNGTFFSFYETTLSDGFHSVFVDCNDSANHHTNTTLYFSKDITEPVISSLFPVADNSSIHINIQNMTINMGLSDNIELYSFLINTKNSTGAKFNDSIKLTGNISYNYNRSIYTLNWSNETHYVNVKLCDSHTAKEIKEADKIFINNGILNFTFGNIWISLEADYSNTIFKTEKLENKYTVQTSGRNNEKNIFALKSNYYMDYLMHSRYKGHFVIDKYWVDFEPYDVIVYPMNDYYRIEIKNNKTNLDFKSIGELNCIFSSYEIDIQEYTRPSLYNISLISDTNWFNNDIFDTSTLAGVFMFIFAFLLIAGFVAISEITQIPVFMALSGISSIFVGFLIYVTVSAIIGAFFIIFSVLYIIRAVMALKS